MRRSSTLLGITLAASLLLVACLGGDDEPSVDSTATESPSTTSTPTEAAEATGTPSATRTAPPTASPTPKPVEALVTTDRLNVRTGPGLEFPVIGQLFERDVVQIVGWTTYASGERWYGILGTGWVADSEEWLDLDRSAADRRIDGPDARLGMVGLRHKPDVRTGTLADDAIEAVLSGDATAIEALVRFPERPCSVIEDFTAPGCGDLADGTLVRALPISACHEGHIVDREQLAPFIAD